MVYCIIHHVMPRRFRFLYMTILLSLGLMWCSTSVLAMESELVTAMADKKSVPTVLRDAKAGKSRQSRFNAGRVPPSKEEVQSQSGDSYLYLAY